LRSASKVGARGSSTFSRRARRRSVRAITLSTSPISRLRAANEQRRQAKGNKLADKLTVEAKVLADLKVEKAAVEGERRTIEADLGPVVAMLLDPAAVLLLLAAVSVRPR
jgi:hypothetical protein